MTTTKLSNLKNAAILAAALGTSGAAFAGGTQQTQPIINVGGPENFITVEPAVVENNPVVTATGTATAQGGDQNNQVSIAPISSVSSGGNVNGTIADYSQTLNNAGGAEVFVGDTSATNGDVNGNISGTITDNSQTLNNAGGAELNDNSITNNSSIGGGAELLSNIENGGVTGNIADNSTTNNSNIAGGAELLSNIENGGVTGTIEDNSTTNIDASSQNDLAQNNNQEQSNNQAQENNQSQDNNQTNSQSTSVDNSGSGNSQNQNTQNTSVGGNNSSYTNNSVYKAGAAANIPQAAAILATKQCSSSFSFGAGGGNVYAGYGGLSFGFVGSEAVALTGKMKVDGETVEVAYTIPELADLAPTERAPVFANLRKGEQEKATCLMGNYIAQERSLQKAYDQATKVAEINANAHTTSTSINAQANMYIAEVQANSAVQVEQTRAIGQAFNQTVTHSCNLKPTVIQDGANKQAVVKETLAIRGQGHENCEQVMWGTFNALTNGAPVSTQKPDFTKYTQKVAPAPKQ